MTVAQSPDERDRQTALRSVGSKDQSEFRRDRFRDRELPLRQRLRRRPRESGQGRNCRHGGSPDQAADASVRVHPYPRTDVERRGGIRTISASFGRGSSRSSTARSSSPPTTPRLTAAFSTPAAGPMESPRRRCRSVAPCRSPVARGTSIRRSCRTSAENSRSRSITTRLCPTRWPAPRSFSRRTRSRRRRGRPLSRGARLSGETKMRTERESTLGLYTLRASCPALCRASTPSRRRQSRRLPAAEPRGWPGQARP